MSATGKDLLFALRSLRTGIWVTLAITVCLGIGVMANVTVFSIVNGLFFRSLPYPEPARLLVVGERQQGDPAAVSTAAPANYLDLRSQNQVFEAMGAFQGQSYNVASEDRPEVVSGAAVTPGFFAALERPAVHGRLFEEEEVRGSDRRLVVLSHEYWASRFDKDPEVLGRDLTIDEQPHTIVGVLPEDFEFLTPNIHLWTPLSLERSTAARDEQTLLTVGRLREGVSMADARGDLEALWTRLTEDFPDATRGFSLEVLNLRHDIPDESNRQVFVLMQGAMLFVLLIACANIGNLLLARGQARQGEFAIRSVLGAGPWRIVRQLLTESLVLALVGGIFGLLLGAGAVKAISSAMAASLPSFYAPAIDLRVILFTVALVVLATILFGFAPALVVRSNLAEAIKQGSAAGDRPRRRLVSNTFIVAQIAVALILLGGAGTLLKSFLAVQTESPGFETENLMVTTLSLPESRYGEEHQQLAFHESFLQRVKAAPAVQDAALASSVPRSPSSPRTAFNPGTPTTETGQQLPRAIAVTTTPEYSSTLGVQVLEGRYLRDRDRRDTETVVAVSDSLSRRFWPDGGAVGEHLTIEGEPRRIVGVVGEVKQELALGDEGSEQMTIYLPVAQNPTPNLNLLTRTGDEPKLVVPAIREALLAVDPDLPVPQSRTFTEYQGQFLAGAQIFTALLGGFGSLALFLAALGIYGVVAYSVAQRTREIGVRMALGARKRQVVGTILLRGLKLAGIGFLLGVPGILALNRVIESALSGIVTTEPQSLVVATVVLAGAILLACWLPARRATRIEPTVALRL